MAAYGSWPGSFRERVGMCDREIRFIPKAFQSPHIERVFKQGVFLSLPRSVARPVVARSGIHAAQEHQWRTPE
jgi:hypothetical protein